MKLVKEHINFQRGLDPKKAMRIGILTWDKLEPGDILQNIKPVYFLENTIFLSETDLSNDKIREEKYWIIKEIIHHKDIDILRLTLIYTTIFRHAVDMSEKIKLKIYLQKIPEYTTTQPIETWKEWFRIIQPFNYDKEH